MATKKQQLEEVSAEETEAKPQNGVLVMPITDNEGKLGVNIQVLGDTRITEIDTILRIALKTLKESLGVE